MTALGVMVMPVAMVVMSVGMPRAACVMRVGMWMVAGVIVPASFAKVVGMPMAMVAVPIVIRSGH